MYAYLNSTGRKRTLVVQSRGMRSSNPVWLVGCSVTDVCIEGDYVENGVCVEDSAGIFIELFSIVGQNTNR